MAKVIISGSGPSGTYPPGTTGWWCDGALRERGENTQANLHPTEAHVWGTKDGAPLAQHTVKKWWIMEWVEGPGVGEITPTWTLARDFEPPTVAVPNVQISQTGPISPPQATVSWSSVGGGDPRADYSVGVEWWVNGMREHERRPAERWQRGSTVQPFRPGILPGLLLQRERHGAGDANVYSQPVSFITEWLIPAIIVAAVLLVSSRALRASRRRDQRGGTGGADSDYDGGDDRLVP